jgi:hypothetical protein
VSNGLASLGGIPFQVNPYNVSWDCSLKVVRKKTVGGFVVQILGVHVGDITVSGVFAYGDQPGDGFAWKEQELFRQRVKGWAEAAERDINQTIVFSFPAYNWNFEVYVKEFTSQAGDAVVHDNTVIAPDWTVKLFIVNDRTKVVIKGIEDTYIKRLFNGVGWKQTSYNGPVSQTEADNFIKNNGGSVVGLARQVFADAALGVPFVPAGTPSTSAGTQPVPGSIGNSGQNNAGLK